MLTIFNSLIPVILTITLGFVLKRQSLFTEESWSGFENLCYFILFPALMIKTLATAKIASSEVMTYAGAVIFGILAMSVLMLLLYQPLKRFFSVSPPSFTSLFQGVTRWHTFIALTIAGFLYGDAGIAYIAITMAAIIPLLNIINVSLLATMNGQDRSLSKVMKQLVTNPFILSCGVGALLNVSGIGLPNPFYTVFDILGGGALGLGLLAVGAGLHIGHIHGHRLLLTFGTMMRLIGMPLLMFLGTLIFGIEGMPRSVAILAGAVPTSSSSYVLARLMGGDAPLMANLITVQVISAIITLPLMIWLSEHLS